MSATSNDVNDDVLKATKTYRQQRRHVIALYLLALLVMMVLFGWLLSEQYRQEIEAAESRITARANVVAEWAKGVFAQSGQALFGLAEMLTLQGMPDSDNAQALQRSLENLTLYVPMVDEIAVLSAEGRVLASGRSSRRAGADISDTTFFNAFKQPGQEELITPLYWSSSDQRYYLYHGRRLETSSGEFAGVVISSIVPEVFADALEQMSVYDGESIALVDPGLKFIARYPPPERPFSIGSQIESPETAEWLTRGESTWSINIDSPIDGRTRLFRMLRVGEYPMLAVVGVDLDELLSAWRQRALILTLVIAVIALLGAWGARHYLNRIALSHQLRQRIEEREQARAEAQIAAAAFQTHLGILITDPQGIILKVNETFSRITGYSEAEIVGNNPRMFSSGLQNAAFYRRLWKRVIKTGNWEGEIWNQRKNGELFPEWLTISAVYSVEGTLTHYVATMSDISERKAAEQEIHQLAFYDTLTGLANRRLFMDRIGNALKELQRHQRCGALLFIDIDNFKQINDTLGHYAGDQVLQSVARRMGQMLRDTDTLARLGSDEFAVLIEGVDSNYAQTTRLAERIAHKLLATLNEPITLAEESITVTGSIGIAIMVSNEYGVDDYLQQVDMALFQAKNNGRHGVCFFDPSMQAALLAHVKLEADLRQAQASQQWQLYYQPQVDHHGVITGVEALLRWHHPERGMVSPGDFIPLLESNELINDVGEWVLEDACYQLARWAQHPRLSKLTISVNISPLQFRDEQFLARVEGVFARTQAPLQRLKLEVTESLFVEARDDARDKMLALKARGVRFSLDDFGTGYSSLAYLAQLPLDQLKIDQSFVQQVLESQANAAIVESTIALAESLNLEVIAEGVETKAQQAWLLAHDCHAYQGYLFGRPVTADAIERLMTGA
ncbi:EAL domain-containing protein [Halomonas sp. QX-2]|jgi:diguanylate cyclase (GGDEF)-like protein/PAS domain S-box-containing protein|uniref:cyclic-guanylate-specific phosphodiesterase n=1 Tax=Vreelandella sedimenti TaxID=2729618 RepID=A0A7Z0SLF7_9GAMM|nr:MULTISPECIES: EAL domain-containing protein [Halomonas]NYT71093.1 EAL domain-containing protein [Halomonas sedimenti]|tara:strand:- start:74257 stop:76965 length:2709 start_codon:yes stop_codon:yes gene_type:complete